VVSVFSDGLYGARIVVRNARSIKFNVFPRIFCHVPTVSSQKKPLIFVKIVAIHLLESLRLPTPTSVDREVVVALLSSWVVEASEAVEADSAEVASVEAVSEAVVLEAGFNFKNNHKKEYI
jgi:hypothetical protein